MIDDFGLWYWTEILTVLIHKAMPLPDRPTGITPECWQSMIQEATTDAESRDWPQTQFGQWSEADQLSWIAARVADCKQRTLPGLFADSRPIADARLSVVGFP